MRSYNMEVSQKVDGKYVKVGEVEVFYPLLSELGISINPSKYVSEDAKGNEVDSTEADAMAFPVYDNDKVQFAFDAVLASVKAMARNRLQTGSATLKDGLTIASTVDELLESGSGNKGEALAILREFLKDFGAWVKTLGKKEVTSNAIINLAKNRSGLALQPADKKEKFSGYLIQFAGTLDSEKAERYKKPIIALNEACTETEDWE